MEPQPPIAGEAPVPSDAPSPVQGDAPAPLPGDTPAPLPGDTPAPVPGHTPALVPSDAPTPLPNSAPAPLPGDTPTPLPGDAPAPIQGDSLIALLDQLQDIATPPPVPLTPQTWAWAAVAAALLAALALAAFAFARHRRATAWRRAALAELAALTPALAGDDPAALARLETLLRRVALATAPRAEVAPLTGPAWADHLTRTGFGPLAPALAQAPYRPQPLDGAAAAAAARAWIRRRHA